MKKSGSWYDKKYKQLRGAALMLVFTGLVLR